MLSENQFKQIKLIHELEEDNCHSEAMVEVAKYIGNKKYIEIFKHCASLRDIEGSLDPDLGKYQYRHYCEMRETYPDKFEEIYQPSMWLPE